MIRRDRIWIIGLVCVAAIAVGAFLGWYQSQNNIDDTYRIQLPEVTGKVIEATPTTLVLATQDSNFRKHMPFVIDAADLPAVNYPHVQQHMKRNMLSVVYFRKDASGVRHAKIVADSGAQRKR